MESKNQYKEERFDSFLNKTIILSSKAYFKKQMNVINKENTIVDNENFSHFLQSFIELDCPFMAMLEIIYRKKKMLKKYSFGDEDRYQYMILKLIEGIKNYKF